VEFTAHGPVVEHIVVAPRPTGLYALKPILSNNAVQGTERVTSMEKRVSGDATVVGVNGGNGTMLRGGILDAEPADMRSSVGIDTDGTLHVDRVVLAGTWRGSGQRRILGLNEVPRASRTTLYTRAWGARTPAESGGAYAVLQPFPASKPNAPLTATVTGYLTGGNQPIPADGAGPRRARRAGRLPDGGGTGRLEGDGRADADAAVDERAGGCRWRSGDRPRRQAGVPGLRELRDRDARVSAAAAALSARPPTGTSCSWW
jgi:hypothetical protein